jgi:hypothetical protein
MGTFVLRGGEKVDQQENGHQAGVDTSQKRKHIGPTNTQEYPSHCDARQARPQGTEQVLCLLPVDKLGTVTLGSQSIVLTQQCHF